MDRRKLARAERQEQVREQIAAQWVTWALLLVANAQLAAILYLIVR